MISNHNKIVNNYIDQKEIRSIETLYSHPEFFSGSEGLHIAVLHPRKLVLYTLVGELAGTLFGWDYN